MGINDCALSITKRKFKTLLFVVMGDMVVILWRGLTSYWGEKTIRE